MLGWSYLNLHVNVGTNNTLHLAFEIVGSKKRKNVAQNPLADID
jgi:hypothetical protein